MFHPPPPANAYVISITQYSTPWAHTVLSVCLDYTYLRANANVSATVILIARTIALYEFDKYIIALMVVLMLTLFVSVDILKIFRSAFRIDSRNIHD